MIVDESKLLLGSFPGLVGIAQVPDHVQEIVATQPDVV
jgi:hypothetical protein